MADEIFSAQVRNGDKHAWLRIKVAIKKRKGQKEKLQLAAKDLGLNDRTLYRWIATVDGLAGYLEGEK